jgi:nucleoside phosphorylase
MAKPGAPPTWMDLTAGRAASLRDAVDLLVVTATEVERDAVLARLRPLRAQKTVLQGAVGPSTYYLGALGAQGVALTLCRMGAVGSGASRAVVAEACALWAPRAVVMVGIAFGKDPEKQRIGDVLVASQILSYEEQRVGARTEFRGPAGEASRTLVDRFRNVVGWAFSRGDGTACKHKVGAVLSGEKLVDDAGFKAALFAQFPHALGGEMEGRGLYAAASEAKVDWILVKAICDWGDGSKHDGDQPLAAAAAVDLMCAALGGKGALDGLAKPAGGGERKKATRARKKAPAKEAPQVTARERGVAAGRDIGVAITGDANKVTMGRKR